MYPHIYEPDNTKDLQFANVTHSTDNQPIGFFVITASTIFSAVILLGGCILILGIILKDSYVQYYKNKVVAPNNLVAQAGNETPVNTPELNAVRQLNSFTPLLNQNEDHKNYNSSLHVAGEVIEITHAESTI